MIDVQNFNIVIPHAIDHNAGQTRDVYKRQNLDHVAQCHVVALVERVLETEELASMSAVIETQRQLEDVVEDLLSSVHGVPKKRTITPVYDTEDIT